MPEVRVALGERSYPIHIGSGILDDAALYAPHVERARRMAIVTNVTVAPLYLARVKRALAAAGADSMEIVLPDGEREKRWETLDRVVDALLAARCDRRTPILALGGGVIGDLAGFAAAVYQRGVPFLQVPTTLLAQVDSSVGGKTAINHARGKNMVGAFHQPSAVITDVATLDHASERELKAGLAEVIKHGLILDAAFVAWLEANLDRLLAREADALAYAVQRCCELKARVVQADERETGLRALLNFGHTFAHAIETGTGYGAWLHGEAVGAGMVAAARLSALVGAISQGEAERVRGLIARAGLPTGCPSLPFERYVELMAIDKKSAAGQLNFVLLERIGQAKLASGIDGAWIRQAIEG